MDLGDYREQIPQFDEGRMHAPTPQYVAWVDVMGAGSSLLRSLSVAANFVMKLHIAALSVVPHYSDIKLYPMIDGLYCRSGEQPSILGLLKEVFFRLGLTFVAEREDLHRFCIRGGLAYGPVLTGEDIVSASDVLSQNSDYCSSILLGITLTQAFDTSRKAAPFGISLDESVRAFAPTGASVLSGTNWKWWKFVQGGDSLIPVLKARLTEYQDWCKIHSSSMIYKEERIEAHKKLVMDFFTE
jgi:hypothetical protein